MTISWQKVKDTIVNHKEAHYGQFLDLEMVVDHLRNQNKEMDTEEAVIRFLHELSKAK